MTIDELTVGTFTLTNLGAFGVEAFTPIINPPEVAVLGVGRIELAPMAYRGQIALRQRVVLSLTFDHRLIDGAPAARFLARVRELVEQATYRSKEELDPSPHFQSACSPEPSSVSLEFRLCPDRRRAHSSQVTASGFPSATRRDTAWPVGLSCPRFFLQRHWTSSRADKVFCQNPLRD